MGTEFSELLTELRLAAGFPTAYRFFTDNGGTPVLKTTYRRYLLIEAGKVLPKFKDLGTYIYALRLTPKFPAGAELILAWLKTGLGADGYKSLLEPLLKIPFPESPASPLHKALDKHLANSKYYVTPPQLEAIVSDKHAFVCWSYLSKDLGAWSPKDFAATVGIPRSAAVAGMQTLAAVKLLKKDRSGLYSCPFASRSIEMPSGPNSPRHIKKMLAFRDELIASAEFLVYRRAGLVRASFSDFSTFLPLLSTNIMAAAAYASAKKQKDSALFAVDCKVVKIRDF